MIRIPKEVIIQKIRDATGLTESDVNMKIKRKLDQLSGLISEEGAAHIIANELGVKVYDDTGKALQVKDIIPGMKSVNTIGKVTRLFEIRTFDKEGRSGKLGSFLLGDETGTIRVVAWNDKADLLTGMKEGDIVKIEAGYARDNNRGMKELHIGDRGKLSINPEGAPEIKIREARESRRKSISEIKETEDGLEIMGTVVQVFDPKFFMVCPQCGKKVREEQGAYFCEAHKEVKPDYSYVLNLFLDDGTDNMRVVLWKNQVQRLLGKPHEEIVSMKDSPFDTVKNDLLGRIIKFVGRSNKNEMFGRVEFVPQLVFLEPNPDEEIGRLNKEIGERKEQAEQQKASSQPEAEKEEKVADAPPKAEPAKPDAQKKKKKSDDEFEILSLEDLEDLE
jgi:ssDNA-binding replication factor A large subunit